MKKILIVEDEEALSNMYRIAFELAGFDVVIAQDGLSGLFKMTEFSPDFILLDIMMPKLNGFEFLSKLKALDKMHHFQIIANSNLEQKDDEKIAISLGVDCYLRKSLYTAGDIVKKVEKYNKTQKWE